MTRPLILSVLVVGSAACVSVRPLRDPARYIAESRPPVVYVTHNNGALLTIRHPRVSGDSLHGTWAAADQPLALPLNQFRRVAARQSDKTRTTFLIAGLSVFTASLGYLVTRDWSKVSQPCNADGAYQMNGCDTDDP